MLIQSTLDSSAPHAKLLVLEKARRRGRRERGYDLALAFGTRTVVMASCSNST